MPGPPTSMPLPQSFLAMLIPVIDPQRNGTVMHLQVISYFSRGLPIQAHQNPLDAQHYSRFLILLCLASNFQQLGDGGLISVRECWAHIAHHCSFFGVCRIIYAHLYSTANSSELALIAVIFPNKGRPRWSPGPCPCLRPAEGGGCASCSCDWGFTACAPLVPAISNEKLSGIMCFV